MARRNIFQPPAPPPTEVPSEPLDPIPAEPRPRFPNTGAMSGMKSTLRDLSSNAVREIDTAMIDDGGPKDRLDFADADVAELAESIRAHGQQVPVMVRPVAERPGYYRVVYGRRRLRALRLLGLPAKALVRSLTDQQAILAQGQENSQRLDPSFIEKALFASELVQGGYDTAVIVEALAIDRPMLSRMSKVARSIPDAVVRAIGPAHGVGRRRWEDLADLLRDQRLDIEALAQSALVGSEAMTSDDRFARLAEAAAQAARAENHGRSRAPALAVRLDDGSMLGEIRRSGRSLSIRLAAGGHADFARWLLDDADEHLRRLHADWKVSRGD